MPKQTLVQFALFLSQKNKFSYLLSLSLWLSVAVVKNLFLSPEVKAQNIPLNIPADIPLTPLPPQPQPIEPQPLPPLRDIFPELEQKTPSSRPSFPEIPDKLFIRKIVVVGNTVFTPDEIAKVVEPFTLRRLSFSELLAAQSAITNLYVKNGYITSGAFLPPQQLKDGIVKIEVIEGKLESIAIEGLERLNNNYVRSRLAVASKAPVNQDKILNALQLLQINPLILTISAELAAGAKPGTSILNIKVQEADAIDMSLIFDNYRSPSVGTDRRQVQLTHSNLLGFGDRFDLAYINTDGSDSLSNLSYTFPFNPYNGTLSLRFANTDSEIIEEPFEDDDIDSESRTFELTLRQPLHQTPTEDAAIGISFAREETQLSVAGVPLPIRGRDEEGESNISAIRLFQEYTTRNTKQVLALRSQFSVGVDVFDATVNDDGSPDSKFFVWRGQAQYLRLLTPDISLLLRSDLQVADDALVPIEQFSLGGALSVRGYRQDALLGDNGLFSSAEIRATILRIPEVSTSLELTPFLDFGKVWNTDEVRIDTNTLVSVGLGLRLLVSNRFIARVDWGIPLVDLDLPTEGDSLQENGIYFSMELKPF